MRIPKWCKMAACALKADTHSKYAMNVVRIEEVQGRRCLTATANSALVWVPLQDVGTRGDLPTLEAGDRPEAHALLDLRAVKEATKGTKGEGRIDLAAADYTLASSGPGKSQLKNDVPLREKPAPPVEAVIARADQPVPATHKMVEVCLDAAQLDRIQEAMGADVDKSGDGGVRLRFLANRDTGRADAGSHGVIQVEPVNPNGAQGLLMLIVKEDG